MPPPLVGFDATKVKVNTVAQTATDVMVINDVPYLIMARGLWDSSGITGAAASFTLGYDKRICRYLYLRLYRPDPRHLIGG